MKPIRIGSASRIEIGYDGENGARAVVFDAAKWMEEMPGCTAAITAQRADGQEYIAPDVTQDEAEKTITWTLTGAETMEGEGRAQLLWMDGERIAKQAIFKTICHESLKSDATQIGVPEPVWAQQSLVAAQEARQSAEAAKASEIGAQNVLEETKGVLDAATGNIVDVGKRADAAQTAAEKNKRDIGQLKADMNGKMDLGDWERGFVSATGVETSNNYTWRTGKIPVSPLAPYKIVVVNHNGYIIRKFNASDEIIGSVSQTGSTSTETIEKTIWLNDDGISYIRMCVTSQDNTNYPANGENVSLFLSINEQYCRNYGEVTPEMFGAVGDGATNDTTALQACIDYAALNGVSVKSVKGRKYKVTQITINKPVDIDLGWATIVSGSASSTVIVNRTTNAAYGNTRVNGTLRRVIFDGNLVSNGILYISNDIRGVYEDLIIQNMGEKVSSSGRTDEDKGTENLSRGIVYAAKPGKGGGNYFRRIYGQMQPDYGSYDTLLIDVMGSDSTFQNIDYQHIKYGIRITGGAFVDNFHGYITSRSIYPGSYCMRVGKNGFVIASQYYPDTQQYGTIVNNDGKPVIINGGTSYFSPDSEIATSGAVSEYPPYLFYGANSDQLTGVNVCGMYFNAPEGVNGEPYTYTLCNVDTQLKIINAVYNNIIGAQE